MTTPPAPHSLAPTRNPAAHIAAWSAHHPRLVVAMGVVVLALSIAAVSRIRVASSLQAMLGETSPAAAAMHRVSTNYQVGDAMMILIEVSGPASGLSSDPAEARRSMLACAAAFREAILRDPEAAELVSWVRFAPDPAVDQFARGVILPHGALYLEPDGLAELRSRLTKVRMAEQLARNEALVTAPGPAGAVLSASVLKDPLRLFELIPVGMLAGRSQTAGPASSTLDAGEFSSDGRALLVRVGAGFPVTDLDRVVRLYDLARRAQKAVHHDGLSVSFGGTAAIAATSSRAIRRDSIVSTLISVAALYVLFVLFSRRWTAPVLIGGVAGVGMLAGFGAHAMVWPEISPLAAAVAALLAGLGVDYGIHFLAHYDSCRAGHMDSAEASVATAQHMGLPIITNCLTSIFGFASLWPSSIRMLSDFAGKGAAGLVGALVAVFVLMPALLVLTDRRPASPQRGPRFGFVADVIASAPKRWMWSSLLVLGVCVGVAAVRGMVPRFETDLTILHPQPNPALDTTNQIIERFAGQGEFIPVEVAAPSAERLVPLAHHAARALQSFACREAGVAGVLGIHQLLPDPRGATAAMNALARIDPDRVVRDFDDAVAGSIFSPDAYQGYRSALRSFLRPTDVPDVSSLIAFPSLAARVFPSSAIMAKSAPTSTVLLVRMERPLRDRARRDAAVSELSRAIEPFSGVTIAGLAAVSADLERATRTGLPQSILISIGLVLAWLLVAFRAPSDVLLALTPLLFAAVATVSFIVATGQKLNPINSVAIPLLDGIAVDAGVFLVATARTHGRSRDELRTALRTTAHAVLLAVATTVTGFVSLCFTATPAIRSLGLIAAVGIAASMAGALFVLMPILIRRAPQRPRSRGS